MVIPRRFETPHWETQHHIKMASNTENQPSTNMVSSPSTPRATASPRQGILRACQTDDVYLAAKTLSCCARGPLEVFKSCLVMTVQHAIRANATNILRYAFKCGAESPGSIILRAEPYILSRHIEILKILLANGWNINKRSYAAMPPLWYVLDDGDFVKWYLEHGAKPDLVIDEQDSKWENEYEWPPILENAASESSVATFELLRSKGGELGPRTLHLATKAVSVGGTKLNREPGMSDREIAETHQERVAMVRHLVDTLKLDPNALDMPRVWVKHNDWGTPLFYMAGSIPKWNITELMVFLRERGADPRCVLQFHHGNSPIFRSNALQTAKRAGNNQFLSIVEDWEADRAQWQWI